MSDYKTNQILTYRKSERDLSYVFIHPIGGQVYWYRAIAKKLDEFFSVYMLLSRAAIQSDCPVMTIEEMAIDYFNIISKSSCDKKIVIIAWSFGCEIAFELVKLMEHENNYRVPIILIDPQKIIRTTDALMTCFYEVLKKELQLVVDKEIVFGEATDVELFLSNLIAFFVANKCIKKELELYYYTSIRTYFYNLFGMNSYARSGSVSNALIIMATHDQRNNFSFMQQSSLEDWKNYVVTIDQVLVSGDHYSILQEEQASTHIARLIETWGSRIFENQKSGCL